MADIDKQARLFAAKVAAQKQAQAVPHDSVNQYHKYHYTSAEAIISEAKSVLNDNGLALSRSKATIVSSEIKVQDSNGREVSVRENKYCSEWLLVHDQGGAETLTAEWPIVPEKGRPIDKAVAAADTTTLAYLLRDLLCLPRVEQGTEMDDNARDVNKHEPREDRPRLISAEDAAALRARLKALQVDEAKACGLLNKRLLEELTVEEGNSLSRKCQTTEDARATSRQKLDAELAKIADLCVTLKWDDPNLKEAIKSHLSLAHGDPRQLNLEQATKLVDILKGLVAKGIEPTKGDDIPW